MKLDAGTQINNYMLFASVSMTKGKLFVELISMKNDNALYSWYQAI